MRDIVDIIQKLDIVLVSIVLFGSLAKGGYKEGVSDVDLILVIDDHHSGKEKARLDAAVTSLEYKHQFRENHDSAIDFAYNIAESMTGMFISHFIAKRDDFINARFERVFNVNPILSRLLAPTAIVWNSVIKSAKTIWGEDVLKITQPFYIRTYHIIKSMVMNSLLNILAYATFHLHQNSTKFSMEASKWTLHSCYFCLEGISTSVEGAADYFKGVTTSPQYINQLLSLREEYRSSSIFIWKTIQEIVKIHLYTLDTAQFPIRM